MVGKFILSYGIMAYLILRSIFEIQQNFSVTAEQIKPLSALLKAIIE